MMRVAGTIGIVAVLCLLTGFAVDGALAVGLDASAVGEPPEPDSQPKLDVFRIMLGIFVVIGGILMSAERLLTRAFPVESVPPSNRDLAKQFGVSLIVMVWGVAVVVGGSVLRQTTLAIAALVIVVNGYKLVRRSRWQ